MSDTDRGFHRAAEQIYSRPAENCVKLKSRTPCRVQHHCHLIPLHSVVRTSVMVSIVTCMYFLSVAVGYASCSESQNILPAEVAPTSFGTFNLKELEEIVYDIEILKVPVPEPLTDLHHAHNANRDSGEVNSDGGGGGEQSMLPGGGDESGKIKKADDIQTTHSEDQRLILLSKYGQKYICTLPQDTVDVGSNGSDSENETKAHSFNVSALLHPLAKQDCLTKNTGWWTYEYCHGNYIRQYHSEAAKTVKNLWIGDYVNETVWSQEEISKAKERIKSLSGKLSNFQIYHSVHYENGTICDLTGKPRRATARIFCSLTGEERLVSVQEQETCDYVLHIETPLLCKHRLFEVISLKKPHSLSCSPLVSQEEFQQYTEKQERLKLEKEQQLKEKELAARKKREARRGGEDKPARNMYRTISDLLDPVTDIDEITAQVREEIGARKSKTVSSGGGIKLSKSGVSSSKKMSNFGLFDSGTEDQEISEQEQEDEEEASEVDEEELRKKVERFGKDVLEGLMKELSSQMSDWAKDKEPSQKNAWERAIKKTQQTVAKLAEVKENSEKSLKTDKTSELDDLGVDLENKVSSEQTLPQKKLRTIDDHHRNQDANHLEQEQKPSDSATVDKNYENIVPINEQEMKEDAQTLRDKIDEMMELNREALNKRQQAAGELDRGDLEVDELEEGEEEEGELDEETMAQLGEDITEEVQKQLDDIGLGDLVNNVKVKVFTVPSNMLDEFLNDEDEEEDIDDDEQDISEEDEDEEELDVYGNRKESTSTPESSSDLDKDLPAGSSVGVGSHSSKSERKKGKRDNSEVKVFTLKLNNWFPLSESEEEEGDDSSKSAKGNKLRFLSFLEQLIMNPMTEERKKVQELESNYEQVWEDIDGEEAEKRKVE